MYLYNPKYEIPIYVYGIQYCKCNVASLVTVEWAISTLHTYYYTQILADVYLTTRNRRPAFECGKLNFVRFSLCSECGENLLNHFISSSERERTDILIYDYFFFFFFSFSLHIHVSIW